MQFRVSPNLVNDTAPRNGRRGSISRPRIGSPSTRVFRRHLQSSDLTVPGRSDRYYQIPFGMHWSEVTASSFMEVGIDDGEVKRGEGEVERSCYCIHAPIHKALPQAKAVFHTHMPYASALTRLEDPRIKEIGQTEVGLSGAIAYDDEYTGPALDPPKARGLPASSATRRCCSWPITASPRSADRRRRLRHALLRRARRAGADLRDVDRAAAEAASAPVVEKTSAISGRPSLQGPDPVAAPLRCLEADARSERSLIYAT
jgi:hypothetical protein